MPCSAPTRTSGREMAPPSRLVNPMMIGSPLAGATDPAVVAAPPAAVVAAPVVAALDAAVVPALDAAVVAPPGDVVELSPPHADATAAATKMGTSTLRALRPFMFFLPGVSCQAPRRWPP